MTKRTAGILGTLVLAIFLTAFAGSALAGNGNGKDNGKSQADAAAQPSDATVSPGNSENAPGHNKSSASVTSTTGSASQNSPATPGMKPTNSTSKNATCTTGGGGGSGVTCAPSRWGRRTLRSATERHDRGADRDRERRSVRHDDLRPWQ